MFTPKRIDDRHEHRLKEAISLQCNIIKMCQEDPELTNKMAQMASMLLKYQEIVCNFADIDEINLNLPLEKLNYSIVMQYFSIKPDYLDCDHQRVEHCYDYLKSKLKAKMYKNVSNYSSTKVLENYFYELLKNKKILTIQGGEKILILDYYNLNILKSKHEIFQRYGYQDYILAIEAKLIDTSYEDFSKMIDLENNRFSDVIQNSYMKALKKLRKNKILSMVNHKKYVEILGDLSKYPAWLDNISYVYYYKH